jgi:diguanylate cyclase (GGDEF)-like protein/PAS domain S-box-containing protein
MAGWQMPFPLSDIANRISAAWISLAAGIVLSAAAAYIALLHVAAHEEVLSPAERWLPLAVLLTGGGLSLLSFGFVRLLERRKAEDARAHLAAIVENSDDAIVSSALDGTIVTWNRGAERMFGYTAAEAIGRPITFNMPAESLDRELEYFEQVRRGEVVRQHESQRLTRDGRLLDVLVSVSPLRDGIGAATGASVIIHDISELKRVERELRGRTRLTELLEALARATNEAATPADALRACLERICEYGAWSVGHVAVFAPGHGGEVAQLSLWQCPDAERFAQFMRYTDAKNHRAQPGAFIGAMVHERRPIWLEDLASVPGHVRLGMARELGLRSAFAFPVVVQDELTAYLEFFSDRIRKVDEPLLASVGTVAGQLARLIERGRAEAALRESEERYRTTFDNAPVGIMHTEVDTYRILRVNRKLCEMVGYTREELLGMTSTDLVHPDYRFKDRASYAEPMFRDELRSFTSERKFVRKDGSSFWVNRTVSLVKDASGTPLYFIRIVEDITERKQAEIEQQRKTAMVQLLEALARAANEAASPLAAMRVSLERICEHGGWALGRLGIYGHGEGERFPETSLWHPEGQERYRALEEASSDPKYFARGGHFISVVLNAKRPVWLSDISAATGFGRLQVAHACGLRSAFAFPVIVGGEVAAFLEFFGTEVREPDSLLLEAATSIGAQLARLIERRRAEEEAARERALLRTIIDTVPDFIYVKDAQGRFQLANRAWLRERNLGREDIVGKTVFDVFPPELAERMERQDAAIVRTGVPLLDREQEVILKTPDGSGSEIRWASITKVPMCDPAGNIIGTVGISRDITERRLSEKRRDMEHAVTRILAEAATVTEAMPKLIRTVCEAMGWSYGARWVWSEEERRLLRAEWWCEFEPEFDPADREYWLGTAPGDTEQLPSRVWHKRQPEWLTDLHERAFLRRPSVAKFGWRSVCCFPILAGDDLFGVIEFYGRDLRQPDRTLLQTTGAICSQIGQFMARKQAEERVQHLAHYDELTGLPNRNMFHERLSQAFSQAQRHDKPLAVLFIDLDGFKIINDTLGHDAGDRVLKEVAGRLRGCLRESDTVGRLGGDEFVVLVEEFPQPVHVAAVAQKILTAVGAPFPLEGREFHVTASIGISTYPEDGRDVAALLKNADAAMYRAKEQGKNNYQFYSAQTNIHSLERLRLESELRRALERSEFVLHYQPRWDLRTGSITGMEALIRWQLPAKEPVPPAHFIPLAEESGLIVPIGEWVLKAACTGVKAWQNEGLPPVRVAVNLSARQFVQESLLQDVGKVLQATGLDPELLEFEIAESAVMRDPERAARLLERLKAMGIHLSIDDFGTGCSSLGNLKRLPVDSLKIDHSFVRGISGDCGDNAAITRAIIAMAHSLGLRVIAEGVETRGQLEFLRQYQCDEAQGCYLSAPLREEEAAALLWKSQAGASLSDSLLRDTQSG